MVKRALAGAVVLALAGCDYLTSSFDTNEFSGDEFPILVDDSSGAIIVGVQEAGDDAKRIAVLDVLAPWTLIDRGAAAPQAITTTDLTVLGLRPSTGELDLPRARFVEKQVLTLHPCREPECAVGTPIGVRPFNALIGLDSFAGDALRIRLATDEIFILPDIAGSAERRARVCDSVMESPFRGGGTLVIGGTELGFTNRRIALDACIAPHPARLLTQSARGVDALFVLSTAIGTSMIGFTAYERIRQLDPSMLPIDQLPEHTIFLPSGPVAGALATLPSIALVSNSGSNPRAPCRQMWASHLLAARDCEPGDDCPCTDAVFCGVPALVELKPPFGISVLIVPDTEPTLHALRTELRPDRPEVDGILGTEALAALELDIDYAHDRLLARCVDRMTCGARVAMPTREFRTYVNSCLGDMPGPIVLED
ncbi:MAG TPA: hypothetical protein VIV11_24290 [Kofleriaceae bacterium]